MADPLLQNKKESNTIDDDDDYEDDQSTSFSNQILAAFLFISLVKISHIFLFSIEKCC